MSDFCIKMSQKEQAILKYVLLSSVLTLSQIFPTMFKPVNNLATVLLVKVSVYFIWLPAAITSRRESDWESKSSAVMKHSNNSHDPMPLTSSVVIEGPFLAEITFCVFKCCCTQSRFSLTQNERHSKLSYQMCQMLVYGMRTTLLTWSWCHMSLPRFLEGRLYQDWKEEAAVLQSSVGEVPAAQDLLPFCWLFCGSSSIRQVELYTQYIQIRK